MSTAVETIKNFMGVLTNYSQNTTQVGRIALDDAIRQTTTYSSLEEAVDTLKEKLADTTTYPDTDTRLREVTGMILGNVNDLSVDTGAISGYNAGGAVVKNAQTIVPEDGDMSAATLPVPGSTTPITYTGSDGTSHTFYVKWPDSFTEFVGGFNNMVGDGGDRLDDSLYYVDINAQDPNDYYDMENGTDSDGNIIYINSPTYAQIKSSIETSLKGLNTWWLREGAKLNYDSLGLALDGQTIEIKFVAGGNFDKSSAITYPRRGDSLPSNFITVAISIGGYGNMNPNDSNGVAYWNNNNPKVYLDRVVAHELVHAAMMATGSDKKGMPQFFTEGIAEVVQGEDDFNAGEQSNIRKFLSDSDTLVQGLSYLPGTGGDYDYAAGNMFMRFIAKQNLDTTAIVGDPNQAQTFDYNGKDEVITNYVEADKINYNASFKFADVSKTLNDFYVTTNDDNVLVVRDVRGKLVTFTNPAGTAYGYMAPTSMEVDGNNINGGNNYEILFGANYENDILRAGNAGSFLWGGLRGDDVLYGGAGADTFIFGIDGGNDIIYNAENQDSVIISGIKLEQIAYAPISDNGVNIRLTDGSNLTVNGQATTFNIANDDNKIIATYRADYQNHTWSQV